MHALAEKISEPRMSLKLTHWEYSFILRLIEQAPDDAMLKRWPGVQTISGIVALVV
jgi:hypothetical protein